VDKAKGTLAWFADFQALLIVTSESQEVADLRTADNDVRDRSSGIDADSRIRQQKGRLRLMGTWPIGVEATYEYLLF
jgi:hypothetical protein